MRGQHAERKKFGFFGSGPRDQEALGRRVSMLRRDEDKATGSTQKLRQGFCIPRSREALRVKGGKDRGFGRHRLPYEDRHQRLVASVGVCGLASGGRR